MTYFAKITYPPMLTEMTKISDNPCYSQGAHGHWEKAAQGVVGLLYNDAEGWGIIQCDELPEGAEDGTKLEELTEEEALAYIPAEFPIATKSIVISSGEVLTTDGLTGSISDSKVWYGDKLLHRWDVQVEPIPEVLQNITLDDWAKQMSLKPHQDAGGLING